MRPWLQTYTVSLHSYAHKHTHKLTRLLTHSFCCPAEERQYRCEDCDLNFESGSELLDHQKHACGTPPSSGFKLSKQGLPSAADDPDLDPMHLHTHPLNLPCSPQECKECEQVFPDAQRLEHCCFVLFYFIPKRTQI